jgi:hypothetical protein
MQGQIKDMKSSRNKYGNKFLVYGTENWSLLLYIAVEVTEIHLKAACAAFCPAYASCLRCPPPNPCRLSC